MHSHDRTLLASMGFSDPDRKSDVHTLACQYLAQPEVALRLWNRLNPDGARKRPTVKPVEKKEQVKRPWADPKGVDGLFEAKVTEARMEVPILRKNGYLVGFSDILVDISSVSWSGWSESVKAEDSPKNRAGQLLNELRGAHSVRVTLLDDVGIRTTGEVPANLAQRLIDERDELAGVLRSLGVYGYHFSPDEYFLYSPVWWTNKAKMLVEVKVGQTDIAGIIKQMELYKTALDSGVMDRTVVATCYQITKSDLDSLHSAELDHVFLGDGFQEYVRQRRSEPVVQDEGL